MSTEPKKGRDVKPPRVGPGAIQQFTGCQISADAFVTTARELMDGPQWNPWKSGESAEPSKPAACLHRKLSKLADTVFIPFPSYKEGFRFYRCEECGDMLKAIESEPHVVAQKGK